MESPWENIIRLFVGLVLGWVAFLIYTRLAKWILWSTRRHDKSRTADFESGGAGYLRICGGVILSLIVLASVLEDAGTPFTAFWWQEVILKGDWIFILVAAPVLALGLWMRHNRTRQTKDTR